MTPPSAHHLFHPAHGEAWATTLRSGIDHLSQALERVTGPSTGTPPELAAKLVADVDLDAPLGETGAALEELSRLYLDDAIWFHEPGYAAHLNCPVVIPALLAELFISSVNSSLDTFDQSVGGTFIERHLIDWTAERIGFTPGGPSGADGIFTSGGTQSNLQALHLARGRFARVPAERLRILASADGHFSVQKAARMLGLDDEAVICVPVDDRHRMDPAALDAALTRSVADGLVPMAVVATAGTTDFGAVDPLPRIAELCRDVRTGVTPTWLHVDAAYGGGLLASTRRRHLLDGIERADSVTVDYHKTWFQPVSASAVIVRDTSTLRHVTWHADYLNPKDAEHPNQVDKSLQTTRRFDALKLWLSLRIMGPDLIGDYFDTVIDLASDVHRALVQCPDIEVAAEPSLSTIVFRYRSPGLCIDETSRLNTRIRSALYAGGRSMVAATRINGEAWLKFTLLNPMATAADILAIVDEVRTTGGRLLMGEGAA
ncbi:aspartate aminotransferase family protein [Nocardioides sp. AE5]|uniref:pyridoxal phosphate-dependent decarboxylase family protein n=1 Tax=Nocardioides sp. AE5 TaxID=2962573 RepID=UPI00288112BD|nr:aspartate aminotransferase family protein [Nocardioides sp. AE5]MDT0203016.1 aspartate aminotransferase family protein [Nocardioides sp. AE5]